MNNNAFNQQSLKRLDIYYKILLVGPRKVGKTQILKRICKEDFNENYSPSFGLDFRIQKNYSENFVFQIMELSDRTETTSEIIKDLIIEADCFICIYDITNINSVRELSQLVDYYEQFIPSDNKKQCWYFVGNKSDDKNRECTNRPENLFNYVPNGNIGFIEISAKENKYIDVMFRNAITRIGELRKSKNLDKNDNRGRRRNNKTVSFSNKVDNVNSDKRFNDSKKDNNENNDDIDNTSKKEKKYESVDNKKCDIF